MAALGALLLAQATNEIQRLLPGTSDDVARELAEGVSSGGLPAELSAVVVTAAREGYVSGLNQILLVGAVIAMAGAVLSVWLVRPGDIRVDDDLR